MEMVGQEMIGYVGGRLVDDMVVDEVSIGNPKGLLADKDN